MLAGAFAVTLAMEIGNPLKGPFGMIHEHISRRNKAGLFGWQVKKKYKFMNPDFAYGDRVSLKAIELMEKGFVEQPEDFVRNVRALYFEAAFDDAAGNNLEKIRDETVFRCPCI